MPDQPSEQPKRASHLPPLLAALVFLTIILYLSPFSGPEWPKVGDTAPYLNKFPIEGDLPETTNRVVLLDFWASWCGPCELSFPIVHEMHQKYSERGLLVIGVSVDQDPDDMQKFLRRHPVTFPNIRDRFGHLQNAFNAGHLPRSFVIGADGKFVGTHDGFDPVQTRLDYMTQIEAALKTAGK